MCATWCDEKKAKAILPYSNGIQKIKLKHRLWRTKNDDTCAFIQTLCIVYAHIHLMHSNRHLKNINKNIYKYTLKLMQGYWIEQGTKFKTLMWWSLVFGGKKLSDITKHKKKRKIYFILTDDSRENLSTY